MRLNLYQLLVLAAFLLCVSNAYAAPPVPDDMLLAAPESIQAKKAPVRFSHQKHMAKELECTACHHTWDGTSKILKCSSAGCHDQPSKKEKMSFYKAFHASKAPQSCIGCHKAAIKQGNKSAPKSCKQCHPKK